MASAHRKEPVQVFVILITKIMEKVPKDVVKILNAVNALIAILREIASSRIVVLVGARKHALASSVRIMVHGRLIQLAGPVGTLRNVAYPRVRGIAALA